MSNLIAKQVEEYIHYKQALGIKMLIESQELRRFAKYTISQGCTDSLTTNIALNWVSLNPNYTNWYKARRLETVRLFAEYISIFDSKAQIPPKGIYGKCHGRKTPYIYTEKEIHIIMNAATYLFSTDGLRPLTISTAIGLMWATGIRPSEACKLTDNDVNIDSSVVHIRETKFSKNRDLPIHKSVVTKLTEYTIKRNILRTNVNDDCFFITTGSKPLTLRSFEYAFTLLRQNILADSANDSNRLPRLFDIRHTFACNTILRWYKENINVNTHIPYLSTYMGHVKVADTYWYLTGTPELLQFASNTFEKHFFNGGDSYE